MPADVHTHPRRAQGLAMGMARQSIDAAKRLKRWVRNVVLVAIIIEAALFAYGAYQVGWAEGLMQELATR